MREVRPGWAGVAVAVVLVPLLASLGAGAGAADTAPTVSPIHAEFHQDAFLTVYSVTISNPPAGVTPTYEWKLTPPTADPGCKQFGTTDIDKTQAIWHHGDQDGCNHNVTVAQGHPGTVEVTIRMLPYICTGSIFGTETMDSSTPVTCVDQRPSPSPSPTHTFQTPSPNASQIAIQQKIADLKQLMADDAIKMKQLKDEDDALSHTFNKIGIGFGVAGAFAGAIAGPAAIPFGIVAGAFAWGADDLAQLSHDPADPSYQAEVTPQELNLPPILAGGQLTPALAADLNAVSSAQNRFGADTNAVRHAWEKANGSAQANDAHWTQVHLTEFATFTDASARDLDDLLAQLQKLQTDLQATPAFSLSAAQLEAARAQFPANAPAAGMQALQSLLGQPLTDSYVASAKQTPLDQPFPALLTPAELKTQAPAMSTTLRDMSGHTSTQLAASHQSQSGGGGGPPFALLVIIALVVIAAAGGAALYLRSRASPPPAA